ncbi:hypothetical protein SR882_03120 [Guyparkeria halophila]|uniref:Uncharacterized protein n=1 Tax=Guyparkeria halophila TaxID=47960 RepID=A0ABZ0YZZ6_9GAMM|nr:hypothetical protein [Guyparkeria halophila]WQH16909.1 hypothetical protein SR882_03120 [Guyparkeria halophila]
MALRVDREAALGWLGIEGFRPSGRVRPAQRRLAGESDVPTADGPVEPQGERQNQPPNGPQNGPPPAPIDIPVDTSADRASPVPDGAGDEPRREAPVVEAAAAPVERADEVLPDRVCLAADSPHRALAEAIAQVAGLACETGEGGDIVTVRGETWELASLAGDGAAKRRLWRALTARGRRARG